MQIVDILLYGLATVLFAFEAYKTRSLLAAGAFFFALAFLIHALV
jgi:hypothetical protein